MKTKILMALTAFLAACAQVDYYEPESLDSCPKVQINEQDRAIIQKAAGYDLFKIEVVGYDGHCYYDERVSKVKAVVSPRFKITRLDDTSVEDVHFSYYIETAEGPTRFLGKKTYFAEVKLPKGGKEAFHTPKPGELSIPAEGDEVDILVGLYAIRADSDYLVK
ncbi:MAG: hypothetical protein IKS23_05550 [Alphaproteobacteria bacterium]|nr:hypothetical protein [Alphaproteobacteria bacterium]